MSCGAKRRQLNAVVRRFEVAIPDSWANRQPAVRRVSRLVEHPSYSINLSARARTEGAIIRSNAFEVFRLMISAKRVGCSTGRSAGLAPFGDVIAARVDKCAGGPMPAFDVPTGAKSVVTALGEVRQRPRLIAGGKQRTLCPDVEIVAIAFEHQWVRSVA